METLRSSGMSSETNEKFKMTSILLKRVREMVKMSFGRLPARAKDLIDAAAEDVKSGKVELEE